MATMAGGWPSSIYESGAGQSESLISAGESEWKRKTRAQRVLLVHGQSEEGMEDGREGRRFGLMKDTLRNGETVEVRVVEYACEYARQQRKLRDTVNPLVIAKLGHDKD